MITTETNPNPVAGPLSPAMRAALTGAAARWDRSITDCDRRTWRALYRRGLVELRRGLSTGRRGETVYNAIVDVKITDAGYAAIGAGRVIA